MPSSLSSPDAPVRQKSHSLSLLHLSSLRIWFLGGLVLVNLFAYVLIWQSSQYIYRQDQQQAEITTQNLTKTLISEFTGTIKSSDLALQAVILEYRHRLAGDIDDQYLNATIERLRSALPEAEAIRIADAEGRLVYGSGVKPEAKINLADRPHFIHLRDDPQAELAFSKPQQSRVNQQWVIVLARRIIQPDGSFGGMAFATITLEHLSKIFSSLDVGPHGVVALRNGDLGIIARHPKTGSPGSMYGNTALAPKFFEMYRTQPLAGTLTMRSQLDNIERTYSYHRVGPYPFYMFVGLATADYLAESQTATTIEYSLAAFFTLLSFAAAWLFHGTWKRQHTLIEELARQEIKFRTVADHTADWEYWQGPKGEIRYMTPSCENITGYSAAEFTADPGLLLGIMHPEDRDLMAQHLDEVICRHIAQESQLDFRILRRDGNIRWIAHHCHAITQSNGEYSGRRASNRDITDRKQIEQALLEQKNFLATVLETEPECVKVIQANGTLLQMNQAGLSMLEVNSVEEANAQRLINFVVPEHRAAFLNCSQRVLAGETCTLEFQVQGKRGTLRWLETRAAPLRDPEGKISHLLGVTRDITQRKATEDEIKQLAFYDTLTQLPNRRLLLDRLRLALASSSRSNRQNALLFIDLDNFKSLNDTLGHDVGDQLLQQVAQRLASCVREGDTVARMGGDEFVIMLNNLSENIEEAATQTKAVAEKILAKVNQPYMLAGRECRSSPSIGATLFIDHQDSIEELLKRADLAMYQAKAAGRNTLRFFDPEMQTAVTERTELEADLRTSLAMNQFLLYYQSHVDEKGRVTGAEALLRWQHPRRGLLNPADFIPLAEETGLILPLGQWVLETACIQLAAWAAQPENAHLTLTVNVSARQFLNPDFVPQVLAALDHAGADGHKLRLDLNENMLMRNEKDALTKMAALKAKGVRFSLDNFGINYFSLTCLNRLPLDQLKIDQSIVRDILTDAGDATIARTILAMAQSMGLEVIAEGVETGEQREFLAKMSCQAFQGYLFSRPTSKEEFGQPLPG